MPLLLILLRGDESLVPEGLELAQALLCRSFFARL